METDLRHSHRSKRIIKKQTMTSEGEIKTSKNPSEKSKTNSSDDVNLSSDFQNDIKKWKSKRENLKNADYMEGISPKNCANQSQSRTFQSDTEANENVETRICSENDFDNDGKSDMGNDGYTSESEMRKCEVCDKCIRNSTYASHLLWCLKRFGRENTTKNVQKSRRDPCCVCKQDLHGMTLQEKAHHVNWCVDNSEKGVKPNLPSSPFEAADVSKILSLECPLCGRVGESAAWRSSHLKRCAGAKKLSPEQLMAAIDLQRRYAEERKAAGLPLLPPKRSLSRRQGSNRQIVRQIEPLTALQADMQMAVACSLSLQHEEHIKKGEDEEIVKVIQGQMEAQNRELESVLGRETPQPPLVSKSRASHKKRQENTPVLLRRTKEDRDKIIAQRLEFILGEAKKDSDEDGFPFLINWKQLNTRRSTPSSPKPESRLWKLASLAADVTSDPNAFYVSQLKSYFKPSKFKAGTKFQHLSQLPGYDLSKKSDHENDILPSTMAILEDLHDKNISTVISPLPSDSRQLQEEICRDGFFTQAPSITTEAPKEVIHSFEMNFLSMVDNEVLSDVKITVEDGVEIPCHKFMLYIRCPSAYKECIGLNETQNSEGHLSWPYVSHDGAIAFLQYIYTGKIVCNFDADEVTHLAEKYNMRDLESYVRSLPQAFTSQNFENIYDSLASSLEDGHVQTSTPSADQPPLSESASPEMGLNSNRHEAHEYGNLGSSENSSDSLLIPKSDKVLKSLSPPVSNVHTSEQQTPDSLHRMSQPTPLETYITEEEEGEEQKQEATEEKNKNFMALKAELAHLYSFILESSTDALSSDNLIDSSKFKKSDRSRLDHEGSMSPDLFDTLHHSKAVLPDDAGSSNHSPNFSSVCAYDSSQLADEAVSQLTNTSLPHMSCKNADSKKSTNSLQHPTEALTKEQSLCSDTTNSCVRKRRSATQRVSSTHSSYAVDFSSLEPQKLSRSYKIPKKKLKVDPKMSLELHSTPYVSDEIGRIPPKTNETSSVDEKNILPVLTNTKRRESKQSSECTNSEQSWSSDTVNSSLPKQRSNSGVLPSLPSCVPDSNSQKSRKIHGKYKIPKKKLSVDPEISSVNQSSSCANVGRRTSKNQKSETINSVQQDVFTFSFKDELHESQSCAPKSNVKSPSRSYSTARQSQYRSHTLDEFNSTPILNKSSHSPPVFSAMNNSIMGNYDNFLCNKELKFNMKSKNQSFTSEDMDQNRFDTDEALQQNVSLANNDWDDNGALNSQLDDVWDNFNDDCIGYDPFSPAMTPYVNKQMLLKASEQSRRISTTSTSRNEMGECRLPNLKFASTDINNLGVSDTDEQDGEIPEAVEEINSNINLKGKVSNSDYQFKKKKSKKEKCHTPYPRYSIMPTPDVRMELKKIGVRQLPKKRAVDLLKHVFSELHPGHPGICTSDPQPRKYPENEHHLAKDKQKTRTQSDTELIRGAKGSGLSKMVNNEHKSIPRSENESVDYKFQSQCHSSKSSQSKTSASAKEKSKGSPSQELMDFLRRREDWNLKMLQYQTIDINAFHSDVKKDDIKYTLNELKDRLDTEGITYTSGQDASSKGKRKKRY